ncbi:ammonium transporter [Loktanella sp. F6476L]|uniref:ammonium transporter n=1 Tax=Loktanella sp. F6476L TaxID=2926405 RepID=UPI001FF358C6|nr:ammonium transporter [Loktanella sp. F6476L]MCK0119893.1 ammonium transporter [Loktanella sp. F6476L]
MNGADTAWMIVATALVLFMTLPGLALFYGGLVRSRNVLSVFMHCYAIACLMSILWFAFGYSIAFGSGTSGYWGGLDKMFLNDVDLESLSGTLPEILFFAFQMTFAIITPALIVGAYVERIGFGFVLLFSSLWMLLCYAPVVHWVWGGGMLANGMFFETAVMDFAGGIVVHETAGLAALILAVFLGARKVDNKPPHNPGMVMIGAAMLWVGWFGFNGGSQLAADAGAAMALTVTHLSAAAASLTWALWEKIKFGKASLVGIVTGTIAGLASVTPASGFINPIQALIIGAVAGILCQEAVNLIRNKVKIDDTLDVFAVHGVGGIFGTIMIAVFGIGSWASQLGALAIVGIFTTVVTVALIYICKAITPLRVDEETEVGGLDLAVHGERAYDITS